MAGGSLRSIKALIKALIGAAAGDLRLVWVLKRETRIGFQGLLNGIT